MQLGIHKKENEFYINSADVQMSLYLGAGCLV